MKRVIRPFAVATCAVALAACATVARTPYTPQDQSAAVIPGIPDARVWADDPRIATEQPVVSGVALKQPTALALSGGGSDGAFGAGLLVGWSERGTRPQCTIVTGASAGALIAPFAFLGPAYDEMLKSVFASGEMANLLQSDGLADRPGALQARPPPGPDRETCRRGIALRDRPRVSDGPPPLCCDDKSRRAAHRDLGHGQDRLERRARGAQSFP